MVVIDPDVVVDGGLDPLVEMIEIEIEVDVVVDIEFGTKF